MPTYRKKPVEVEAFEFRYGKFYPHWFEKALANGTVYVNPISNRMSIKTLEGIMQIEEYDYVIQGVKNEIYPCKPDIFELTYEEVK